MTIRPDISIIIPIYNCKDYIQSCLGSLLNQERINLEFILVDDGSTDGTSELLKRYVLKHPSIIIITQENKGAAAARNKGIEVATGKYILFVDADDTVCSNSLQVIFREAEKEEIDIIQLENYYKKGEEKPQRRKMYPIKNVVSGKYYLELMQRKRSLITGTFNSLLRKDFLCSLPFRFDENLIRSQDMDFFVKAILKANKIRNFNYPYYIYNMETPTGGSTSRNNIQLLFLCYEHILKNFNSFALAEGLDSIMQDKLNYIICTQAYNYKIELLKSLPKEKRKMWKRFIKKYMFRNQGWLRPYIYLRYLKLFNL